jgi:PAS domain S-box-containing protein
MESPVLEDEVSRLRALADCRIVDTPREEFFDEVTSQATYVCGTPIGLIGLVDAQREWFKSKTGWDVEEVPRDESFSAYAVRTRDLFIVEDATRDKRFQSNPWVTQAGIRFYAGAPLLTKDGYVLGALCVLDRFPRTLPLGHMKVLQTLADAVAARLEVRRGALRAASSSLESRYRLLFEQNVAGYYRATPEGRVLECNGTFARMLGYASRDEVLNCEEQEFYFAAEDRKLFLENPQGQGRLVDSEVRLRRKDGTPIWVVENVAAIRGEQPNVEFIERMMVDISAHKRADDVLRDSQERLFAIVTSAMDAIITVNDKQQIIVFNQAAEEIFGCSATEAIGKSIDRFIPESYREIHRLHIRNFGQTGVTTRSMYSPGTLAALRSNGEEFPIEASISQVTTSSEKLYTVILRDISVRKRTEEQLRHAQKMEAVGQLAGGIAHEFNNYLGIIMGYADLLEREMAADESLQLNLAEIKGASQKAASLTRQLLAFSRKQVIEPRELDLNSTVWEAHKLLRRLIPASIDLIPALQPDLGKVKADPAQIEQILINLVLNARDSMPQGGTITIETAAVELDEEYASRHLEVQAGRYVMLAVGDTGVGMDRETLSHIFDPFFTTKEEGRGTGLGLSTTYGIVKQSGGHVTVASVPGKGTTFTIYLPLLADSIAIVESSKSPSKLLTVQTVLLVEDESALRKLIRQVLARDGFTVLEAKDGEQALSLCERHPQPIDLVVTDLVMPKLNGFQLREKVAGLQPAAKFLLISGYAEDAIENPAVLHGDMGFLEKPFLPDELIHKVRQVLKGNGAEKNNGRTAQVGT